MPRYFEFEVSLCEIEPKIWRRFQLLADIATFADLHDAIQSAGDWWDYHMWMFKKDQGLGGGLITGSPTEDDLEVYGRRVRQANVFPLTVYFGEKKAKRCFYEYDMGDGWLHEVKLLREVEFPDLFTRRLVAGERAFPHEDSGGVGGYGRYVQLLRTGKDPWNEDPKELLEWLGGWEPEKFDLAETKAKFDMVTPPRFALWGGKDQESKLRVRKTKKRAKPGKKKGL